MENKKTVELTFSALKKNAEILFASLEMLRQSVEAMGEKEQDWFKEIDPELYKAEDALKDQFIKNFWDLVYMVDRFEQLSRTYKLENSNKILDILDKLNEISVR